jgi:hypothetical protein
MDYHKASQWLALPVYADTQVTLVWGVRHDLAETFAENWQSLCNQRSTIPFVI